MEDPHLMNNIFEAPLWTIVDVVLDNLFDLLPLKDLHQARLTCKRWASVGGQALGRRTVICVTDSKFAEFSDSVVRNFNSFSNQYLWECHCIRKQYASKKFASIDFCGFPRIVAFDSNFYPKNASVLGSDTILKLTQSRFSRIQCLQLIKIPFFQISLLLNEAHLLFENLTQLEFREISVKSDTFDVNFKLPQAQTLSKSSLQPGLKSNLQSLVLEVSPYWIEKSWNCLDRHTKLSKLEINWYKNYIRGFDTRDDILRDTTNCYGEFLRSLLPRVHSVFTAVAEISLRFELTSANMNQAKQFLNEFSSLKKIRLQVRGSFSMLENLLNDLKPNVKDAVFSLHVVNKLSPPVDTTELNSLFIKLDSIGFFKKPHWSIVCCSIRRGWVRFTKTRTRLVIQFQGKHVEHWQIYETIELVFGRKERSHQDYNYAFHHVVSKWPMIQSINDHENFNESTFFNPYFLGARWRSMLHSVCHVCRNGPRLLADLPGFQQDIGIGFGNGHSDESNIRTWTFMFVPRPILAKWRIQLVSETAKAKDEQKCLCRWWDFVTRMKYAGHPRRFTDQEDKEFPNVLTTKQVVLLARLGNT